MHKGLGVGVVDGVVLLHHGVTFGVGPFFGGCAKGSISALSSVTREPVLQNLHPRGRTDSVLILPPITDRH